MEFTKGPLDLALEYKPEYDKLVAKLKRFPELPPPPDSPDAKKKGPTKVVTLRVPPVVDKLLDVWSEMTGEHKSALVNAALQQYLTNPVIPREAEPEENRSLPLSAASLLLYHQGNRKVRDKAEEITKIQGGTAPKGKYVFDPLTGDWASDPSHMSRLEWIGKQWPCLERRHRLAAELEAIAMEELD